MVYEHPTEPDLKMAIKNRLERLRRHKRRFMRCDEGMIMGWAVVNGKRLAGASGNGPCDASKYKWAARPTNMMTKARQKEDGETGHEINGRENEVAMLWSE